MAYVGLPREDERPRSQVILAEITRQVADHRSLLDTAIDLNEITVTVKLHAGSNQVRAVAWSEERIKRDPARRHP